MGKVDPCSYCGDPEAVFPLSRGRRACRACFYDGPAATERSAHGQLFWLGVAALAVGTAGTLAGVAFLVLAGSSGETAVVLLIPGALMIAGIRSIRAARGEDDDVV